MSAAPAAELHPALAPLAFLLGTWRGDGSGHYPTIEPFAYVEEISFVHVGKPWLLYTQRTRHATEDRPLHAETGYWRPIGDGTRGGGDGVSRPATSRSPRAPCAGTSVDVVTGTLAATPTAKRVDRVERRITVEGDELHYALAMAAVGEPLTAAPGGDAPARPVDM